MKDELVYIEHILQALRRVNSYTEDVDETAFMNDIRTQDAYIRQFEVIGEKQPNDSQKRYEIDLFRFLGDV